MGRANEFEDVLNECLEYIVNGGGVEACLAQHPEYAAELEPLLKTAVDIRNAAAIKPRPDFRQRAANDFQAAVREIPPHKARNPFRWQLRWALPVAIILVLILGGGGTVLAAANSLPDSPLYRVKLATEAVQLAFTRSDLGKAELYARFADRRVEEIVKMAQKGNMEQVEKVTERMDNQLIAMANLTAAAETPASAASYSGDQGLLAAPQLTTPETVTPTTTQPPAVVPGPLPTVEGTPTPTIPLPSNPPGGETRGNANTGKGAAQVKSQQEKLLDKLIADLEENIKNLQAQLDKAPESLKPALQRAIDIAQRDYEEAISNLENGI